MKETGLRNSAYGADKFGLKDLAAVHWNLTAPRSTSTRSRREGHVVEGGAFCAETGNHTGRSPEGQVHRPRRADREHHLVGQQPQAVAGASSTAATPTSSRMRRARSCSRRTSTAAPIRNTASRRASITELAWHSLFIRTLLIRPERAELADFVPDFTILDLPTFKADPKRHGVRSDTMIAIDFTRKIILIGGSSYAGEMKKSVFTTLNFYLPAQGVMPMHCSANVGKDGDIALFFGLSGTGKTTLSADPNRTLIGDDEHGWSAARRVQFRGRLLRQEHQAVAPRPSRKSATRPSASARCWRTSCSIRRPASRTSTTTVEDREHPLGLSARLHPERLAHRPRRACRRTWCC